MEQQEFQSQMLDFKTHMTEFQSQVLEFMRNAEQRFTHIDQRLELMHEDIRDLKQDMRFTRQDIKDLQKADVELHSKLEEVYQARNFVKIKFGWEWSAVSLAIAFLASGLASGMTKFVWK